MRRSHGYASLILAALMITACSGAPRSSEHDGSGHYAANGTFTMAVTEDFGSFDPYGGQIFALGYLAYDSLINVEHDGAVVSGLATKWTADARSASFVLHSDVTCSDGTPLKATDVANAINYVSDPKKKSLLYGLLTPTVPLTASGDDRTGTVKVAVEEPFGFLLQTVGRLPIVCAKGLRDPKLLKSTSTGTGPFVLTKAVPGQSYTLEVRKDYAWGPDGARTTKPGTPAKVIIKIIPNETTAANLLLAGELSLARITGDDRQRADARHLGRFEATEPGDWLWFNHAKGRPVADQQVRAALVRAVDLNDVAKVDSGGTGRAATGLAPVEPRACKGNALAGQLPGHDLAAAKALLDQAGWIAGDGGVRTKAGAPLKLSLHYIPSLSAYGKPAAELLAHAWESLGIRVNIVGDSRATITQVLYETGDFDIFLGPGGFNLPSQAAAALSGPTPPKGTNVTGVHNPEYERLAKQAQTMTPPAACQYWDRAEQALYRQVDVAPISNRTAYWYVNKAEARPFSFNAPVPTSLRVLG